MGGKARHTLLLSIRTIRTERRYRATNCRAQSALGARRPWTLRSTIANEGKYSGVRGNLLISSVVLVSLSSSIESIGIQLVQYLDDDVKLKHELNGTEPEAMLK
jgi:hypothetical protein